MSDIPPDQLEQAPPFTYSAVDYFEPWYIKEGRKEIKHYSVLFTCMASQAGHLETAASLTPDSFLNAYHRFVGWHSPVSQLQSDQGTNFVGAKNELEAALKENRREQCVIFEMIWNCRKNINYKELIESSSYFSANQIENYENLPELNIRHSVSILFRLLPNKDYRPPSCDVKVLILSFLLRMLCFWCSHPSLVTDFLQLYCV